MSFEKYCNKCGLCCQVANPFTGIGRCPKLTDDNKCSIYDTRPDICRVDVMAKKRGIPKFEAYAANIKACSVLKGISK